MKYLKHINESSNNINNIKSVIIDAKNELNNYCLDVIDISNKVRYTYLSSQYLIYLYIEVDFSLLDEDIFNSIKDKLKLLGDNMAYVEVSSKGAGSRTGRSFGSLDNLEYGEISFVESDKSLKQSYMTEIEVKRYVEFKIKYIKISDIGLPQI